LLFPHSATYAILLYMGKSALVFLANGFEEVEAVTPIDYLRRADVRVIVAAIGAETAVTGARGIVINADTTIADLEKAGEFVPDRWDGVFVPGGMLGATNLAACAPVGKFFQEMSAKGKIVAAICAAPALFLAPLGLLEGKRFTCYPDMEKRLKGGTWTEERVVIDGNLITSRAPGTAVDFALALVEKLAGSDAAKKLSASALL